MPLPAPILLLPLQAAVPSAPPAPPPLAPPVMQTMVAPGPFRPGRRVPLDIVVRSAGTILWQGTLTVAEHGGSGWTQSRSEPEDEACGRDAYRYGKREGLNVQLGLLSSGDVTETADRITVTVRWSRRAEAACGGLRIVELRQTATITDRRRSC
jgi:hypothetical protein